MKIVGTLDPRLKVLATIGTLKAPKYVLSYERQLIENHTTADLGELHTRSLRGENAVTHYILLGCSQWCCSSLELSTIFHQPFPGHLITVPTFTRGGIRAVVEARANRSYTADRDLQRNDFGSAY